MEGSNDKLKLKKDSVQETLVIPLFARKLCSEKFPNLFKDPLSAELMERIDFDFSKQEELAKKDFVVFGALEVAMRQNDLAIEIREYLVRQPEAAVVNLGCGLDQTGRNCDNGRCKIYNIDLPDVIEVRDKLLPAGEREKNIAADLNDTSWFDEVDGSEGAVFFAAGVFYYFTKEKVKTLISKMAERFPEGKLVFDAAGKTAVKIMLKTWIKDAEIKDVNAYFSVANPEKELGGWSDKIRVSSKGYMTGYHDLKKEGVRRLFRFMSWLGDGPLKMKIIRMDFK